MSDKPIPAEIVRASDLKPGDHFTYIDCLIMADAVTHFHDSQCVRVDFHIAGVSQHAFWSETAFVARILPEPVEVRDQWLVEYFENGMQFFVPATDRDHAFEVAKTLKGGVSVLCERQSVISREEVQS